MIQSEEYSADANAVALLLGYVAVGFLEKFGLRADAVANGKEAVKALETIPYDLVLMDVQMPIMDGLAATREIRRDSRLRALPIIAMTAGVLPEERQAAFDAGMNDFHPKPIDVDDLVRLIRHWCPAR